MRYVGMQTQIQRNNQLSLLLLLLFPLIILATVWAFLALVDLAGVSYYDELGEPVHELNVQVVNDYFLGALPWIIGGVHQYGNDSAGYRCPTAVAKGESARL